MMIAFGRYFTTLTFAVPVMLMLAVSPSLAQDRSESIVRVGMGSYAKVPPAGVNRPPGKIFRTDNCVGPMPTNDWWSSLAWEPLSSAMFPHPMGVQAISSGLKVNYPGANMAANEAAIMGGGGSDLVIGHSAVPEFSQALVDSFSDWFVTASFRHETQTADQQLLTTFGHGSPFVFVRIKGGQPTLTFNELPRVWKGDRQSAVLGISVANRHYGIFAPEGSTWSSLTQSKWTAEIGSKEYFTIALLPDSNEATLKRFQKYAFSPVTDSKVQWEFDETSARVTTTYQVQTQPYEANRLVETEGTILALYPHQWLNTESKFAGASYRSVRGEMKVIEGEKFETGMIYPGLLPSMPVVNDPKVRQLLKQFLAEDVKQEAKTVGDTYWFGKQLGSWATSIPLAQQVGENDIAKRLTGNVKAGLQNFFTAMKSDGSIKSSGEGLFYLDPNWGTVIGYPASYGSDNDINDHHFHYGYFIRAAGEIARCDTKWGTETQWGGMVKLLIEDVACARRDDARFPFLRNFDPYAGHTWASGHAKFGDGNNNESSSEAINAWYGVILFAEATGDKELRDLGVYLLTTEIEAINHYWFDVIDQFHHEKYSPSVVTMVWGGKGANGTWFSGNPETVHGINWLPVTGASLYLGRYPEYCEKNYQALAQENLVDDKKKADKAGTESKNLDGTAWDDWADLVWMYRGLSDPDDAMRQFKKGSGGTSPSSGNTYANTLAWLATLQAYGQVDRTVWADTTFYAVLQKQGKRTYMAWNLGSTTKKVTFSDGTVLECRPNESTVLSK